MNHHRRLLIAVAAGVLCAPAASLAQAQAKVWRIGVLDPASQPKTGARPTFVDVVRGLSELGYVEGRNITLHWRYGEDKIERLPKLSAELVAGKMDVIVTMGTPAVTALRQATTTIPIVATVLTDPVATGFAASLARPGGNVTGLTNLDEDVTAKRLATLTDALPDAARIGYLANPDNRTTTMHFPQLEKLARKRGREIVLFNARSQEEVQQALKEMARAQIRAVLISNDPFLTQPPVIDLIVKHRLPAIAPTAGAVNRGVLLSYGLDTAPRGRRVALMVDKILKGAKAADIPFEQPSEFVLAVNLKTAKALGITIPQAILLQASRVIE